MVSTGQESWFPCTRIVVSWLPEWWFPVLEGWLCAAGRVALKLRTGGSKRAGILTYITLPGKLVNSTFEKELPYFKAALLLHKLAILFAHSISIFFLNLSHLSCKDQVLTIPPVQFRENMRERGHRSLNWKNTEISIPHRCYLHIWNSIHQPQKICL